MKLPSGHSGLSDPLKDRESGVTLRKHVFRGPELAFTEMSSGEASSDSPEGPV